ncbi:hypothetical protein SASPL_122992 [Salvia splendens]|uniref:XPG-I domain-containing protein n=1 Tax=Salvia splendens TaxID=180675 RepID=A0A8X8XMD3_SALSN|nr:hypothetical protein SASPL_122992 [Salvia splendens]
MSKLRTYFFADMIGVDEAVGEQNFESYFGREIAIDASMSIYQFLVSMEYYIITCLEDNFPDLYLLIAVGRRGTQTLTNEAGEVTSYVFDDTPPDLKKNELAKRVLKRADATNDLNDALKIFHFWLILATNQHYEDCKKLLRLMGVPVVEAPCEAEAQCAALCKEGKVYAVASEDMDSLAFGAPRFLRHLMCPTSKRIPVVEFKVAKVLEELNLTMDQFIDLAYSLVVIIVSVLKVMLLSQLFFLSRELYANIEDGNLAHVIGIGGLTALKLIRQYGSLEHILGNINKERYQIPFDWRYQDTRKLFREPSVLTDYDKLELKWTDPDEEGLVRFLVNENTFNIDRISKAIKKTRTAMHKLPQNWSESYSKPVGISLPAKVEVRPFFCCIVKILLAGCQN